MVVFKNPLLEKVFDLSSSELAQLKLENESLKAQLDQLPKDQSTWSRGLEYKPAIVYSTYPFNNQKLLGITLGSEDGVVELMSVAVSPGILLGQVIEVFPKYSLVQTIFDPEFAIPIRVSWLAEDALLEGGNAPMITLIKKDRPVVGGDPVYSSGIEFPYRMKIGKLGSVIETDDEYFKKAELKLSYNLNDIKKVYVIMNYIQ